MSKKTKIIIGVLIIALIGTYIAFNSYRADRPTATPDLSSSRSIQIIEKEVVIDVETCTPDLRKIETVNSQTIVEVAGKEFDECLINYGPSLHDRNLNQKLPTRCSVPTTREKMTFPLLNRGIDFSSLKEFCE